MPLLNQELPDDSFCLSENNDTGFKEDKTIAKALEVLADPNGYHAILEPAQDKGISN